MLAEERLAVVTVRYDSRVAGVVGVRSEEVVFGDELKFCYVLHLLFQNRPEIPEAFPPGVLGFTVNGEPPGCETPVRRGDVIEFLVEDECVN